MVSIKENKIKVLLVIFIFAVLASIAVYLYSVRVIGIRSLCGWRKGAMQRTHMLDWDCRCIGSVRQEETSYLGQYYCTGVNLSYNKLLNGSRYAGKADYPVYNPESPVDYPVVVKVVVMTPSGVNEDSLSKLFLGEF